MARPTRLLPWKRFQKLHKLLENTRLTRGQRRAEGEMRPGVGAGDLSSAPEPKSSMDAAEGTREVGDLVALKHTGLQRQGGMVKGLMGSPEGSCLFGDAEPTPHTETLAFAVPGRSLLSWEKLMAQRPLPPAQGETSWEGHNRRHVWTKQFLRPR